MYRSTVAVVVLLTACSPAPTDGPAASWQDVDVAGLAAMNADIKAVPQVEGTTVYAEVAPFHVAVLAERSWQDKSLLLLDEDGAEIRRVQLPSIAGGRIAWDPTGAFLLEQTWPQAIVRLDLDGTTSTVEVASWYRFNGLARGGEIVTTDEYETNVWDKDGDLIQTSWSNMSRCYVDAVEIDEKVYVLDMWDTAIYQWRFTANEFAPVTTGLPYGLTVLGASDDGLMWVSGSSGQIWAHDMAGDRTQVVASTLDMPTPAWSVSALETAGDMAVYTLYQGEASGIARVQLNGAVAPFAAADGETWIDMVAFR